jgi:hypothetical protein
MLSGAVLPSGGHKGDALTRGPCAASLGPGPRSRRDPAPLFIPDAPSTHPPSLDIARLAWRSHQAGAAQVQGEGARRARELGRHLRTCTNFAAFVAGFVNRRGRANIWHAEVLCRRCCSVVRVVARTRARSGSAAAVGCGAAAAARAWPSWVMAQPHAARERARGSFGCRARCRETVKKT